MNRLVALLLAGAAAPAFAQHQGHEIAPAQEQAPAADSGDPACPPEHAAMGHCLPKAPAAARAPAGPQAPTPTADPSCPPGHAAMGHCTPSAATPARAAASPRTAVPAADAACPPEHAAMGHCKSNEGAAAEIPVGPPPAAALHGPENAADTVWNPIAMSASRRVLRDEHGDIEVGKILIDRIEWANRGGKDGYVFDGQAWWGGDVDKLWLKGEAEGTFGEGAENVEVQALWSRAIDPWFDLQLGVRHDFRPNPDRTYLTAGVQGLTPYWFEIDVAAFLSDKGELSARAEAEYDLRITQRLILQPRVEIELAAEDVPELGIGAGLSTGELGLRLRYEIEPQIAPYVGVEYERAFGDAARFRRAEGEEAGQWSFLVGLRSWF